MTSQLFDLRGRVALITGSSQGLGLTMACGLGEAGATVIPNGRNEEKLGSAVAALAERDLRVFGCAFDVSDPQQIEP